MLPTILLAISLSLLIGVSLGLLGGGGSILTVPIMIYALGVEEKSAIASSLLVVGATSAVAVIAHARAGNVVWRTALIFAGAGMAGAFLGGKVAKFIPASILLALFAVIMFATAFFMWRGRKAPTPNAAAKPNTGLPIGIILLEGLVVGLVTGLVGAGGGFLVVPALALLGGLSMQKAVGSSLVVIALKSFAGFAGYASHVEVNWTLTGIVTAAAIVGSFGGARLARRVDPETLRKGFAVFVLTMAVFLLGKQAQALLTAKPTPSPEAATATAAGPTQAPTAPPAAPPTVLAMSLPTSTPSDEARLGQAITERTTALVPEHVKSDLSCKSCHLAAPGHGPGTVAGAAPWVGIEARFPQYRARTGKDDTLKDRVNDCFERSLNGSRLDDADPRLNAIVAYMRWLGSALPEGHTGNVAGQGIHKLVVDRAADAAAGRVVYDAKCAACHGPDAKGVVAGDVVAFPPLAGEKSFNIAAGMARHHTAAGFIKSNMPLGQGGTLSDDEAWDVAAYVAHLDRPDFPRKASDWPTGGKPADARY
jgi:cytochrome c/uncharacterized membrane protein YfcA